MPLNRLAGELAQQAVADSKALSKSEVAIAGSLPPQNGSYRPDLVLQREIIEPLYRRQAELLAPYVDVFLCDTMSTIDEALAAVPAVADFRHPVLVGFTLDDEKPGCLRSGESLQNALAQMQALAPAGVMANCCLPERISDAMPLLSAAGFDYCGGYANAFTCVPKDWLLGGNKENDGRLELRKDLSPDCYAEFVAD